MVYIFGPRATTAHDNGEIAMNVIPPTININGTSGQNLLDQASKEIEEVALQIHGQMS